MKNSPDNTSRADMEKALKEAVDRVKEKKSQFSSNTHQAQIKRSIDRK